MDKELEMDTRVFGKDLINLNNILKQTVDEPILYISRKFGNRYIVPQSKYVKPEDYVKLQNKCQEQEKILDILKSNIVDCNIAFGTPFDGEDKISFTVDICRLKNYTNENTGEKQYVIFQDNNFDLILQWLRDTLIKW